MPTSRNCSQQFLVASKSKFSRARMISRKNLNQTWPFGLDRSCPFFNLPGKSGGYRSSLATSCRRTVIRDCH